MDYTRPWPPSGSSGSSGSYRNMLFCSHMTSASIKKASMMNFMKNITALIRKFIITLSTTLSAMITVSTALLFALHCTALSFVWNHPYTDPTTHIFRQKYYTLSSNSNYNWNKTPPSPLNTVHTLHTLRVLHTLHTTHYTLHTMYYVLCKTYYVLHTMY